MIKELSKPVKTAADTNSASKKWLNDLKKGKNGEFLESVIQKSVAVVSGKGGVGKTTTSANLALYYAKKGLKTALIDIDPLSDITSILDLTESESIFQENREKREFSIFALF